MHNLQVLNQGPECMTESGKMRSGKELSRRGDIGSSILRGKLVALVQVDPTVYFLLLMLA
ncbi:hypothetical protein Pint_22468 [Pistacia integerrima]|uniref:Uncharacterized protein n=1 Tax=Pistacia integerrima TaxID=434235 RepID=A0ACC0YMP9_9ROSI|nr:hypothetical protein Pint_22468 [Pistacia integerrima]